MIHTIAAAREHRDTLMAALEPYLTGLHASLLPEPMHKHETEEEYYQRTIDVTYRNLKRQVIYKK